MEKILSHHILILYEHTFFNQNKNWQEKTFFTRLMKIIGMIYNWYNLRIVYLKLYISLKWQYDECVTYQTPIIDWKWVSDIILDCI